VNVVLTGGGDSAPARAALGWTPAIALAEGLLQTLRWFRAQSACGERL
jgi:nucleoside-diphosphate-sugar epimerase